MFLSSANPIARLPRRGLCLVVALMSSLACIGFAIAVWTAPMAGMAAMDDMVDAADGSMIAVGTVAPAVVTEFASRDLNLGVVDGEASNTVASTSPARSLPSTSTCDTACANSVNEVCAVAGGLTVTMLLILLMSSRRDTFLGLQARARTSVVRRLQPRRAPWALLSPIELCVLRV